MQQQTVDAAQERSRLIDHLKARINYRRIGDYARLHKAVSELRSQSPWAPRFGCSAIFFITVVPIFHGGDRSLDVKYLPAPAVGFWGRAAYIWDVYMLLITASDPRSRGAGRSTALRLARCARQFPGTRPP